MALNPFDQFDAPPVKAMAPEPAATGPNPFDQFDEKPAAAAAVAPVSTAAPPVHPGMIGSILAAIHPYVSGLNSNVADAVGLPMAAANSATNTVRHALGGVSQLVTGQPSDLMNDPDPATVPGTPEWLKAKAEKVAPGSMNDPNHPIAHFISELVGPGGLEAGGEAIASKLSSLTDSSKLDALAAGAKPAPSAGPSPDDADPLAASRAAGFKTTASNVALRNPTQQPSVANRVGEIAAGGNDAITASNNASNTARATELAGQQMGLGDGVTKITPPDLKTAKAAPGAVYDATGAKLDKFQPSPNLLNQLRDAASDQSVTAAPASRTAATKILSSIETNGGYSGQDVVGDISKLRESPNTRPIASLLDQEIERQLQAKGDGPGLQKLLDARQKFAQIYAVQDALNGGQVDAQALAAVHRANPNLLTGNIRLIGVAGNELPADVRLPNSAVPGTADASVGGIRSLVGLPARKIMTSDAVQNQFGPEADAVGRSYFPTFGEKPPAPAEAMKLALSPGEVGRVMPSVGSPRGAQAEMSVPQNPRPLIDLQPAEGTVGRITPVQGQMPVPEGPESISGAPPSSAGANSLIRPLGEAFQPHQPDMFPPNNVSKPPKEPTKPKGLTDSDWKLLTSLGFGE